MLQGGAPARASPLKPSTTTSASRVRRGVWHRTSRQGVISAGNRARGESLLRDYDDATSSGPQCRSGANYVFNFQRWDVHRNSSDRYMRHITGLLTSSTWRNLEPPMSALTAIAVATASYQTLVERGALPTWAPHLALSDGPLELTSFALALLLVFRTDSSYGRWVESLSTWSEVRNISKNMVREAVCWIKDPCLIGVLIRWTLTFSKSLKVYLRQGASMEKEVEALLLPHERAKLCEHCVDTTAAYPQYILHVLTQVVERANLTEIREDRLLESISRLNAAIGVCEKILRYPIPLSYTRHTSRFMIIWLTFLPVALWDDCGWLCIPITTMVSFLLLGVEEIGVQIEEPFTLLPLEDFCGDIEKDLWSIAESRSDVAHTVDTSLVTSSILGGPQGLSRVATIAAATGQPIPGASASAVQIDVAAMMAAFTASAAPSSASTPSSAPSPSTSASASHPLPSQAHSSSSNGSGYGNGSGNGNGNGGGHAGSRKVEGQGAGSGNGSMNGQGATGVASRAGNDVDSMGTVSTTQPMQHVEPGAGVPSSPSTSAAQARAAQQ